MKIVAVETIHVEEYRPQLWLQVHTDEGLIGVGETCIGPLTVAAHVHETIAPHMIGQDPVDIESHARTLADLFVGYGGTSAETRANSAFDVALWDLVGQATNRPVYELLGGTSRERLRIYNTCAGAQYGRGNRGALLASDRATSGDRGLAASGGRYEDLDAAINRPGELAQDLLASGITAMKIWPFDEYAAATVGHDVSAAQLAEGCAKLAEIRTAVGADMDVMLEMHGLWQVPAAQRIAEAAAVFEPLWIEDPVRAGSMDAVAAYTTSTRIPTAMGETLGGRAAFAELIDRGGIDVVMFDVGWCGGLTEARAIADLARTRGLPIAPHDCTGPIVLTASSHLAINASNALIQETVRAYYTGWYTDVATQVPTIADGYIEPPRGAGLGVALQPDLARRTGAVRQITTARDL